jgi:branched-chain amino acid transport system permease protein
LAIYKNFVSPDDLNIDVSVEALLMVALGGPATLVGAIIGAGVIVFLRNYVSIYYTGWLYILGGMYIVTILFLPGGIMGIVKGLSRPGRTDEKVSRVRDRQT